MSHDLDARKLAELKSSMQSRSRQLCLAIALPTQVPPLPLRTLIEQRLEEEILAKRQGHWWAGIGGGAMLMKWLIQANRPDLVYTMATKEEYPSWGHMLKEGATTIWEDWESPKLSQSHSSYLYIGAWFIEGLAGIRPDSAAPGFKRFTVHPGIVDSVDWVKCGYDSPYGRIVSNWKGEGEKLTMDDIVPPNTTATIYVPAKEESGVTESDTPAAKAKSVKFLRLENGAAARAQGEVGAQGRDRERRVRLGVQQLGHHGPVHEEDWHQFQADIRALQEPGPEGPGEEGPPPRGPSGDGHHAPSGSVGGAEAQDTGHLARRPRIGLRQVDARVQPGWAGRVHGDKDHCRPARRRGCGRQIIQRQDLEGHGALGERHAQPEQGADGRAHGRRGQDPGRGDRRWECRRRPGAQGRHRWLHGLQRSYHGRVREDSALLRPRRHGRHRGQAHQGPPAPGRGSADRRQGRPVHPGRDVARAVNNLGMVSGYADTDDCNTVSGFIYVPKSNAFIDFLPSAFTIAHGINNLGDVSVTPSSLMDFPADGAFCGAAPAPSRCSG